MHEVHTSTAAGARAHDGADPLDVRVPAALGAPVRVADAHAERRVLAAHLAHRCHGDLASDAYASVRRLQRRVRRRWRARPTAPRRLRSRSAMTAPRPPGRRRPAGGDRRYRDALRAHQEAINRLNVYPVPDGDTGTNMALTLESVVPSSDRRRRRPGHDVQGDQPRLADGGPGQLGRHPVPDPRGVWPSTIERGRAASTAPALAAALAAASTAAYGAVMKPGRGHDPHRRARGGRGGAAAADGGGASSRCSRPPHAAGRPTRSPARPSCSRSSAEAGVVDAGGAGFLLLLDAAAPRGRRPADAGADRRRTSSTCRWPSTAATRRPTPEATSATCATRSCTSSRRPTRPSPRSRTCGPASATRSWSSAATASGTATSTPTTSAPHRGRLDCGRPRQHPGHRPARAGRGGAVGPRERRRRRCRRAAEPEPVPTAVVAVATGDGIRRIFRSLGVQRIVAGGQSMNPSTAELLEAVEAAPADEVVILPNNKNIVPVAEQVDDPDRQDGAGGADPGRRRGLRRADGLRPRGRRRRERERDARGGRQRRRRRGHPGRARLGLRRRADRRGRLARHRPRRDPGGGEGAVRAPPPGCSTSCSTDDHEIVTLIEGEGADAGRHPPHHRVAGRAPTRTSRRGPPRRPAALPLLRRHRVARSTYPDADVRSRSAGGPCGARAWCIEVAPRSSSLTVALAGCGADPDLPVPGRDPGRHRPAATGRCGATGSTGPSRIRAAPTSARRRVGDLRAALVLQHGRRRDATPAVVDDTVYVGDWSGAFYALAAQTAGPAGPTTPRCTTTCTPARSSRRPRSPTSTGSGRSSWPAARRSTRCRADDGELRWRHELAAGRRRQDPTEIESSPVVVDGMVVIGWDVHNSDAGEPAGVARARCRDR